jgi:membrane-associated phospholipid phosphatase
MTTVLAAGRRVLPRGYVDLLRQLVIWFGFYFAYALVRSLADRDPSRAFANGLRIVDFEQRTTHQLFELTAQRVADSSQVLLTAAAWTYWNSEFTVIGLALLWVYIRHHDAFARFRNAVLLANILGLFGYALLPTAPPRLFPSFGFADALDSMTLLNHGSGLVGALANPYAAMPSLHAADSLIVGLILAGLVRNRVGKVLWLLWPAWVWFCVMATANHFWLDVVAGALVAVVALVVVSRYRPRGRAQGAPPIASLL